MRDPRKPAPCLTTIGSSMPDAFFSLLHSSHGYCPRTTPNIQSPTHMMTRAKKKRPKNMAGYKLREYVTAIFQLTEESPLAANFRQPHWKVVSGSYFIRSIILLHLQLLLRRLGRARTL
jgi:hypothetical protein